MNCSAQLGRRRRSLQTRYELQSFEADTFSDRHDFRLRWKGTRATLSAEIQFPVVRRSHCGRADVSRIEVPQMPHRCWRRLRSPCPWHGWASARQRTGCSIRRSDRKLHRRAGPHDLAGARSVAATRRTEHGRLYARDDRSPAHRSCFLYSIATFGR